jgi:hypothetical protein
MIDCTISAGRAEGIRIEGAGTAPTLKSNHIRQNACSGIVFDHGATGLASNTVSEGNAQYGIAVLGEGTTPVFKGITARDNSSGNYYVFSAAAPIGLPASSPKGL